MNRRLYEYKTTYGDAEPYPADPTPPDGEDWEMCGAAERTRRNIAELLAMAYELGHETGRLAEVVRQRKEGVGER